MLSINTVDEAMNGLMDCLVLKKEDRFEKYLIQSEFDRTMITLGVL